MDRTLGAVLVVAMLVTPVAALGTAGAAVDGRTAANAGVQTADGPNPCVGTTRERPDDVTLLSIQGARGSDKTAGLIVSVAPNGTVLGVHNASANGRWWAYDVDPLENGNLLFSSTEPGESLVEEIDPQTGDHVAVRRFPDVLDSHDADLINGDELLFNDMSQDGEDRIAVYNLTSEEVVWEYRFEDHPEEFPHDGGHEYGGDWTHNNDVEKIDEDTYMVSVRNFDQVVAINRTTKAVEWRLGADENHDVLDEQHNPDYIEGADGTPTVLVADSLNDRVVEYARTDDGEWNQTWVAEGGGFNEPRDADRLPNGNTLVADRRGHRMVEITPEGEVVWEFYGPWQPYDVERLGTGDESAGPTMREVGTTGVHEVNSTGVDTATLESCYAHLTGVESQRLLRDEAPEPTATTGDAGNETASPTDSGTDGATDGQTPDSALGTPSGGPLSSLPVLGAVAVAVLAAAGAVVWWRR